jgi:hypothetical protein
MTGPNLTRALAEIADTGLVYVIDRAGNIKPMDINLFAWLELGGFVDGCTVAATRTDAEARAAQVLARIAGRN